MYKTLGIKWLHEAFCPALAFVSADSDEARNPQRFIHVTVTCTPKNAHLELRNKNGLPLNFGPVFLKSSLFV